MRRSSNIVRHATFSHHKRGGYDEAEVRQFLESVADEIQAAEDERTLLLAEIERLRAAQNTDGRDQPEITSHAVALFSQAQLVADRLVAEHAQHSQRMLTNARAQQREILAHTQDGPVTGGPGQMMPYHQPVPEIEYVRMFTRIAQTQLRSVIDALGEQVDKLGELPRLNEPRDTPPKP